MTFQSLLQQTKELAQLLTAKNQMLVTAESCTGGQLAYLCTSIAGSSHWFERGFVTYSNLAKQENLAVSEDTLRKFGAVSEETALAMAEGALKHSAAQMSLVTTGIAGPGGGSIEKPLGTVWIGYALGKDCIQAQHFIFSGNRLEIRNKTCEKALDIIKKLI